MKPRSKRNRKRPRGGIGYLLAENDDDDTGNHHLSKKRNVNNNANKESGKNGHVDDNGNVTDDEDDPVSKATSLLRMDIVPLSKAFEIISEMNQTSNNPNFESNPPKKPTCNATKDDHGRQSRIRILYPYPYTFATYAKSRWLTRSILDVYHEEFGSYPRSYYEAAIRSGRILVNGRRVLPDYKIRGGDELRHTVHRHEPAVALAGGGGSASPPPVEVLHEDDSLLVVDKPATLPVHPCGGYNYNSLFEILSHWKPRLYKHLFTVHRLDRLTSGLLLIAKQSELARKLGRCIMERGNCQKFYLARVKGRFPFNLMNHHTNHHASHDTNDDTNDSNHDTKEHTDCHHPWRLHYKIHHNHTTIHENSHNNNANAIIPPPCLHGHFTPRHASSNSASNTHTGIWEGGIHVPIHSSDITNSKSKSKNNGHLDSSNNDDNNNHNSKENSNRNNNGKQTTQINELHHAALGYWITDGNQSIVKNATLSDVFRQCTTLSMQDILNVSTEMQSHKNEKEEELATTVPNDRNSHNNPANHHVNEPTIWNHHNIKASEFVNRNDSASSIHWLHLACPCRIASHKNGVCEAGDFSINTSGDHNNHNNNNHQHPPKGIKPAQTAFTLLSYHPPSDTSLVLAKPVTGRTHQIRLHLQQLGHPIANDHCYGGELWFGDPEGKEICRRSREWLNRLDGINDNNDNEGGSSCNSLSALIPLTASSSSSSPITPKNATVAEMPATEAEIYHVAANRTSRYEGESMLDFIEKTCVWCARCRGVAANNTEIVEADKEAHDNDADEDRRKQKSSLAVYRRTLMEYLVRSQGIWLHALQYSLKANDDGNEKKLNYRTKFPSWATMC